MTRQGRGGRTVGSPRTVRRPRPLRRREAGRCKSRIRTHTGPGVGILKYKKNASKGGMEV